MEFNEQKYLENKGLKCPYCESPNINGGSFVADGGECWQEVHCEDCENYWFDGYKLVGAYPK